MTESALPLFDDPAAKRSMPQEWQGSAAISHTGTYRWEPTPLMIRRGHVQKQNGVRSVWQAMIDAILEAK